MRWDAVTLAAPFEFDTKILEKETKLLQDLKFLDCEELIISNDACENSGSGGSSLNALLITAERLCAKKGLSILTEDVINNCKILIILIGPDSNFNELPNEEKPSFETKHAYIVNTFFCNAYKNATYMASRTDQKGLWIIGTDSSWNFRSSSETCENIELSQNSITAFTFNGSPDIANSHGMYHTIDQRNHLGQKKITSLSYCNSTPPDYSGITDNNIILAFLYFPPSIAISFLEFHNVYPISASTYYGIDSGAVGLKLSLFFDFIIPTCHSKLTYSEAKKQFIENRIGGSEKCENVKIDDLRRSREIIYEKFHKLESCLYSLSIKNYKYKDLNPENPAETRNRSLELYRRLTLDLIYELTTVPSFAFPIYKKIDFSIFTMVTFEKNFYMDTPNYYHALQYSIMETTDLNKMPKILFTFSLGLSLQASGKGGLRSGPAANTKFVGSLQELESSPEDVEAQKKVVLRIIKEVSRNWCSDYNKMIRAARHFEAAAQILISNSISKMCRKKLLVLPPVKKSLLNEVTVTAPARVDLYGGWLDTPPIFFDFKNASVCNLAIKVDGKDPISCKVEKTDQFGVHLTQGEIIVAFLTDENLMETYNQPSKAGCLLCACIVALGFHSISKFLELFSKNSESGIRVTLASDLPHGSGLGTSSIMAATIIRAFHKMTVGNSKSDMSEEELQERLVLTVLKVEQLMTTGGGWQDQVGAIYPGLKLGIATKNKGQKSHSIQCKTIPISKSFENEINSRLILVYTGRTRLAKNILQEVIRNWYKDNEVRDVLSHMWSRTSEFCEIIQTEQMPIELIELYYKTKKTLAPECEPIIVRDLIFELKEAKLIETGWLAGAGGGGFCYLWASDEITIEDVKEFLTKNCKFSKMSCHYVTVSNHSL